MDGWEVLSMMARSLVDTLLYHLLQGRQLRAEKYLVFLISLFSLLTSFASMLVPQHTAAKKL